MRRAAYALVALLGLTLMAIGLFGNLELGHWSGDLAVFAGVLVAQAWILSKGLATTMGKGLVIVIVAAGAQLVLSMLVVLVLMLSGRGDILAGS